MDIGSCSCVVAKLSFSTLMVRERKIRFCMPVLADGLQLWPVNSYSSGFNG